MNKEMFLSGLRKKLSGLPQEDIAERISFYSEMIDDRMEDGLTEEEAVAGIGTVESVAEQVMSEIPLTKLIREKVRPKRKMQAWEVVLLVLGSPVWIPLLIAAAAVVLAVYAVVWAAAVCVYAADLAFAAGAVAGIAGAVLYLKAGKLEGVLLSAGPGLACAGLAILLFFGCRRITKGVLKLTGRIARGMKSLFVGRGNS